MKVIVAEAKPTYPNGILDQLALASKQYEELTHAHNRTKVLPYLSWVKGAVAHMGDPGEPQQSPQTTRDTPTTSFSLYA